MLNARYLTIRLLSSFFLSGALALLIIPCLSSFFYFTSIENLGNNRTRHFITYEYNKTTQLDILFIFVIRIDTQLSSLSLLPIGFICNASVNVNDDNSVHLDNVRACDRSTHTECQTQEVPCETHKRLCFGNLTLWYVSLTLPHISVPRFRYLLSNGV